MRIDVTYAGEAPRVIETSGEGMLSPDVVAGSPEWRGSTLPVTAVQLRPRTDLACREGHGLVVELCAWSSADGGHREGATLADFGFERRVPRLLLHVFRVWEVLPAEEMARVVDVDIDGRIHLCRIGGELLDLTAYERLEERVLSQSERSEYALDQRVLLVHDRMRRASPGMRDAEVGDMYGLGTRLVDYALSLGGGDAEDGEGDVPDVAANDGLDAFFDAVACAGNHDDLVAAVGEAMLDLPGLTLAELESACSARGQSIDGLGSLWDEAEEALGEDAYDDPYGG